jgi:palmitoyltransferase
MYLILTGKSTVEAFSGRDQQDRESRHLNVLYGFWSNQKEKKLVRKKWQEEYGGTSVDERWRTGGAMGLWKREMGEKWYEWICEWYKCLSQAI